jgi:hypothetical protein
MKSLYCEYCRAYKVGLNISHERKCSSMWAAFLIQMVCNLNGVWIEWDKLYQGE